MNFGTTAKTGAMYGTQNGSNGISINTVVNLNGSARKSSNTGTMGSSTATHNRDGSSVAVSNNNNRASVTPTSSSAMGKESSSLMSVDDSALPESLYTVQWSLEEQKVLEDTLVSFPIEKHTALQRYVQVAALLPGKGVRDVALRVRWMNRKESGKRRKAEDCQASKRSKEIKRDNNETGMRAGSIFSVGVDGMTYGNKEHVSTQRHSPTVANRMSKDFVPLMSKNTMSKKSMTLRTNDMLSQNTHIIDEIRSNLSNYNLDNVELFRVFRDNIVDLISIMGEAAVMRQMPPLPAKPNHERADLILSCDQNVALNNMNYMRNPINDHMGSLSNNPLSVNNNICGAQGFNGT